jgi:hypothetical protein
METEQNTTPRPKPAPTTLGSAIESKHIGLRVLVQPEETDEVHIECVPKLTKHATTSSEIMEADKLNSIVAVHGLAAHPSKTWFHRKTNVNWLSDKEMLPAALPSARIMAFGYESCWYGDDAVKQSVSAVSDKLLAALDDKRKASLQSLPVTQSNRN